MSAGAYSRRSPGQPPQAIQPTTSMGSSLAIFLKAPSRSMMDLKHLLPVHVRFLSQIIIPTFTMMDQHG